MHKINVLDSAVFNRIAAGEVVENPRSIVKELLENSIDAGATSVTVEIFDGGVSCISVTDNGKGIDPEDMPIAFLPHATSKIKSLQDLDAIDTLGFRGEALPSIASVADVEMTSRTADRPLGHRIVLTDGKCTDDSECGAPLGTKVVVKNLFARVPARAKFLRKSNIEESAVTELVAKIILANPSCKIKYLADGEVVYQSDGNGIDSAVYCIYGKEFYGHLEHISYTMPDITVEGFIGKPGYSKHNRTYQTLIVNGRYVVHAEISYCIQQCYQAYLMKRQFPVYILYLTMPTDMVDVNVHPNKLDVRFVAEKKLKGLLYTLLREKIDALAAYPTAFSEDEHADGTPFTPQASAELAASDATTPEAYKPARVTEPTPLSTPFAFSFHVAPKTSGIAEESVIHTRILQNATASPAFSPTNQPIVARQTSADETPHADVFGNAPIRYVGKLFNTYVIVESEKCFYLIDQHAAHEKLLYDALVAQTDTGKVAEQELLVPYIFDVAPHEKPLLDAQLQKINAYGFKIDPLNGNTYALYAMPACCADMRLQEFVSVLLTNIETVKNRSDFLKERLMQAACKSAVKGAEDLQEEEILLLLEQMRQTDGARFCPHGRPIVIRFTASDIEKLFRRI